MTAKSGEPRAPRKGEVWRFVTNWQRYVILNDSKGPTEMCVAVVEDDDRIGPKLTYDVRYFTDPDKRFATSGEVLWEYEGILGYKDMCPRCEMEVKLPNDYVCGKCRYGA